MFNFKNTRFKTISGLTRKARDLLPFKRKKNKLPLDYLKFKNQIVSASSRAFYSLKTLRTQEKDERIVEGSYDRWKNKFYSLYAEAKAEVFHYRARKLGCLDETKINNAPPLLLLHGHTGHKTSWNRFRQFLEQGEIGSIYVIQFEDPNLPIATHAYEVKLKIDEILKGRKNRKIRLIGASRGGVIAAYYTEYLAKSARVEVLDVVTMASPLKGTKLAHKLITKKVLLEDIGFGSEKIEQLRSKIIANKSVRYFHIATTNDLMIIPYDSALTGKNRKRELIVSGYSHNSLLYCPKIASKVIEWLDS